MQEKLRRRLQSLKIEYEAGQKMLMDLEAKQANIRDMLLRISGAIQVLEEELASAEGSPLVTPADAEPVRTVVEVDPS